MNIRKILSDDKKFYFITDRVEQAQFYLEQMRKNQNKIWIFDTNLTNFIILSRSVTWLLRHVMRDVRGFEEWYKIERDRLCSSPIGRAMIKYRNELEKEGRSPVSKIVFLKNNRSFDPTIQAPPFDLEHHFAEGVDLKETEVIKNCEKYLTLLKDIVGRCRESFRFPRNSYV